jgi:type II secretory pathway pseudopilin PulG
MIQSFPSRRNERGYILLTLMLFVALLAIASMAWIEKVDFQIKRDREEELIHRGVQYSRAIRRYVKKFGHYPARIEELESTNNIHYLRKRYKDPITGKDFKLLRMNEVQSSFSPGAASGLPPGSPGAPDASSAIQGGAPGALNFNNNVAQGGPGPSSIPGAPQTGQQPGDGDTSDPDQTAQNGPQTQSGPQNGFGAQNSRGPGGLSPISPTGPGNNNGPSFGGLPIVGVASTSKDKTIREFNKKDHYNQWQFIYDPSTDRGGLLTTPNQPSLQGATQLSPQQNEQPGNPGQNQPGFGFGQGGMNQPQQPPQMNPQDPNQK